jgi:hypothetical protein
MAVKNLTDDEMVEVSSAWVDPQRGRGALEAPGARESHRREPHRGSL